MKLTMSKRIISGFSAAAIALSACAFTASADEATVELPDGAYARAGIFWMVRDQWDHRKTFTADPMDETEENVVPCTHHDVYITGNGQYEVDMSGYRPPDEWLGACIMGYFGLGVTWDLTDNPDTENISITLDEVVIDGTTYTFNEQPEYEDSEDPACSLIKIKNSWGNNAVTTPEMDFNAWETIEPISIKFTVAGLETDKIEDYADETIEMVYGDGVVEYATPEERGEEAPPVEEEEPEAEAEVKEETPADDKAEETKSEDKDSSKSEEKDDEGSNLPIVLGAAGGLVVLAGIGIAVGKKKK